MTIPVEAFDVIREEIRRAREAWEDEQSVYDAPECDYCGREMSVGSVGGGEITFGCYRDDCSIESDEGRTGLTYRVTRRTAASGAAFARLQGVRNLAHALALADRDRAEYRADGRAPYRLLEQVVRMNGALDDALYQAVRYHDAPEYPHVRDKALDEIRAVRDMADDVLAQTWPEGDDGR